MAKVEQYRTDEYFMDKFDACNVGAKCKSIFDHYVKYSTAQLMAERTSSEKRLEELDARAELNFRLAGKKLGKLTSGELSTYLNFIKSKMLNEMKIRSNEKIMLNIKMYYGTMLRQLPNNLTPEQQATKNEMEEMLSDYFVKIEREM